METRRFDELTVALARGGSRRGVLRGLVGSVLGTLALDRSGALAKNDKPKKDDPITIPAKPICTEGTIQDDCPLCAEARAVCCDPTQGEQACGPNYGLPSCAEANEACVSNGTCVQATCNETRDGETLRCEYSQIDKGCPGSTVCCNDFPSKKFGHCVKNRKSC